MGTAKSWPEYIQEASRCLPKGGILLIAEATKSIKENTRNLGNIREVVKENGFELNPEGCYDEYKFTFIEARKFLACSINIWFRLNFLNFNFVSFLYLLLTYNTQLSI